MQINNSRKFLQTRENDFPDLKGTPTTHQYREFLKLHITVKFQIIRVKEKILDDSRKKNQILYKNFRLLNSYNGNQNYKDHAFKLLNDFQSKILYPAKLRIKTEMENWVLRI